MSTDPSDRNLMIRFVLFQGNREPSGAVGRAFAGWRRPVAIRSGLATIALAAWAIFGSACSPSSDPSPATAPSPGTANQTSVATAPDEPPAVISGVPDAPPAEPADRDGWTSEVVGASIADRLHELEALATSGRAVGSDEVQGLVAPSYEVTALRPPVLSVAFTDAAFEVRRGSADTAPAAATDLASVLSGVAQLWPIDADVHVKSKLFRTEISGATARAESYFQASGRTAGGLLQVRSTWEHHWALADAERPRLTALRLVDYEETVGKGPAPLFADCTEAVFANAPSYATQVLPGIDHWTARIETRHGLDIGGWQGLAVADFNGDDRDDVYVCQPGGLPNLLYLQSPDGTLRDVSAQSGVNCLDSTHGAVAVDFDGDGHQDLAVGVSSGVYLCRGDGTGRFAVRSAEIIPAAIPYSLAAADYDSDGDLDLFVCCYNRRPKVNRHLVFARPVPYHDANNGGRNVLLRNDGNWRFRHATKSAGLDENNRRFSYAAAWEDFDGDGDLDLYVANDFGRNNLYENLGGNFRDIAATAGVEDISPGMSVCWGDPNNDGRPDLYVSNMFSSAGGRITTQSRFHAGGSGEFRKQLRRHARGNSLFQNRGDGTFEDVSVASAVSIGRWAWGSKFVDLNSDGWEDLVVTNGFITQPDDTGDL